MHGPSAKNGARRDAASGIGRRQRHRRRIVIRQKAASAKLRMSGARNAGRCPAKPQRWGANQSALMVFWLAMARRGEARRGEAWRGKAWLGAAWQGKGCSQRPADSLSRLSGGNTNEAVHAMAGPGRDRLGAAWRGKARPGTARRGTAWRGKAWRGKGWIQRIGLCKEPLPVRLAPSTF